MLLRVLGLLLLTQSLLAAPQLMDIRHAPHETYYRTVFDLTERTPVEIERHLDQNYINVILHGHIELLAKHLQQPVSPHLLQINLVEVNPQQLIYRLDLQDVFEVHAFRQGGGHGFRFVIDCLHRSSGQSAAAPATTPVTQPATTRPSSPPTIREERADDSPVVPEQPITGDEAVLSGDELLQLLEIVATLEQAGDTDTACRILEEELARYPDTDTLYFRLGSIYLKAGNTSAAFAELDPLLLNPDYGAVVTRLLVNYETGAENSEEMTATAVQQQVTGEAPRLSLLLTLSVLAGLILVGAILLVRHRMAEQKHLASFAEADEAESSEASEPEPEQPKAKKKKQKKATSETAATAKAAGDAQAPAAAEANPDFERDKEVYRLADKKKGIAEIAGTLGLSQDEVRLILQMRHQENSAPATEETAAGEESEQQLETES